MTFAQRGQFLTAVFVQRVEFGVVCFLEERQLSFQQRIFPPHGLIRLYWRGILGIVGNSKYLLTQNLDIGWFPLPMILGRTTDCGPKRT